ncbi:hypothetical protein [Methylobacterium sp. Leaf106]|uniref:hypothetical protein n=1 Tax=Methylobacterium sp. Leaf106 TaxID=1736255 RepID=UPI000A539855|nr:hypothetical protein [Methylobacterium sp. Leaf106]
MNATIRCVCALAALVPVAAPAQDVGASILQGLQQQQFQTLDAAIGAGSVGDTARQSRTQADPPRRAGDLSFIASAELRATTVARYVRELSATDPAAAREVGREMARHDYDTIFRGFLTRTDLRADDAGDVLTTFIVLQWMVANDTNVEPSAAALRAIRRRMVEPLAGKPPLSRAAKRAVFAERVKLRAVLHHAGWQAARRLGTVPAFVAGLSKDFIPPATLRDVTLTEDGLVGKDRRNGPTAGAGGGPAPRRAP